MPYAAETDPIAVTALRKCFQRSLLESITRGTAAPVTRIAAQVISPMRRQSPPQKLTRGFSESAVETATTANWRKKRWGTLLYERTNTGARTAAPARTAITLETVNAFGMIAEKQRVSAAKAE